MLIVISPAKTLDLESAYKAPATSQPAFLSDTRKLVKIMRGYSADDLAALMHTSDAISTLNADRFKQWKTPFKESNARPSIFTFMGDVYTGFEAQKLSQNDLDYAQSHLRILSGLYGALRPLDLMQAYRLEMGIGLKNEHGKDLYAFWGDKITKSINKDLKATGDEVLINLASNEYFNALDKKILKAELVQPVFKDFSSGQYRVLSFFAKKARGRMAAWIIQNKVEDPQGLTKFRLDGYKYSKNDSTPEKPVFLRKK
jgi:cytoplasmic iron level regulating protein YaaA (DUF328/UPF0246 family)